MPLDRPVSVDRFEEAGMAEPAARSGICDLAPITSFMIGLTRLG